MKTVTGIILFASSFQLTGLKSNTKYVMTLRGVGTSGPGPLSPNMYFILSSTSDNNLPPEPHQPNANKSSDQFLGNYNAL